MLRSEFAANLALQAKPITLASVAKQVNEIMSRPLSFKERLALVLELELEQSKQRAK
jgi:hypothetical protein